jgi:hypothetical protein
MIKFPIFILFTDFYPYIPITFLRQSKKISLKIRPVAMNRILASISVNPALLPFLLAIMPIITAITPKKYGYLISDKAAVSHPIKRRSILPAAAGLPVLLLL